MTRLSSTTGKEVSVLLYKSPYCLLLRGPCWPPCLVHEQKCTCALGGILDGQGRLQVSVERGGTRVPRGLEMWSSHRRGFWTHLDWL